jgi:hypothetical protein
MIRKSGNRFSEKMLKQSDESPIRFDLIQSAYALIGSDLLFFEALPYSSIVSSIAPDRQGISQ